MSKNDTTTPPPKPIKKHKGAGSKIWMFIHLMVPAVMYVILCALVLDSVIKMPSPKTTEIDLEKWWGPYSFETKSDKSIQPYIIEFPDVIINDLKERLLHRRPFTPPVENTGKYGLNTDFITRVLDFWQNDYNYRERERFLNKYKHYVTKIQGLNIHYLHVQPTASKAKIIPLLLIHNWPTSIREFYEIIPFLTTHQSGKDFVFEVIAPSLPGFGFSEAPAREGMGVKEIAVILHNLMTRLRHQKYYIHGGTFGQDIGSVMATFFPDNILGFHTNNPVVRQTLPKSSNNTFLDIPWLNRIFDYLTLDFEGKLRKCIVKREEILQIKDIKPDTYGSALTESPAGLAAYILEQFSTSTRVNSEGSSDGGLLNKFSLTHLLDNVMIYWVTNSVTNSMRIYFDSYSDMSLMDQTPTNVPTWGIKFKKEHVSDDSCLRQKYERYLQSTVVEDGGHFPAMQHPQILADDIYKAVTAFCNIRFNLNKGSASPVKNTVVEAKETLKPEAKETLKPEVKDIKPEVKDTLKPKANDIKPEVKDTLKPKAKDIKPEVKDTLKPKAKDIKPEVKETLEPEAKTTIYDFKVKDINGNQVSLEKYRGKVLIIVNVASQCGYTNTHYTQLNELYEKYADRGLRILAFPCNQFGGQEPGTLKEIVQFTQKRNVKFDIFEKIDVNGENAHPLWQFLKQAQGGTLGNFIKWNFSKFIIDRNGVPVERFGPNYNPFDLEPYLEKYW